MLRPHAFLRRYVICSHITNCNCSKMHERLNSVRDTNLNINLEIIAFETQNQLDKSRKRVAEVIDFESITTMHYCLFGTFQSGENSIILHWRCITCTVSHFMHISSPRTAGNAKKNIERREFTAKRTRINIYSLIDRCPFDWQFAHFIAFCVD